MSLIVYIPSKKSIRIEHKARLLENQIGNKIQVTNQKIPIGEGFRDELFEILRDKILM